MYFYCVPHLKKGFVHCYTGSGKGKTTAALGLALRAAGAGLDVFIAQFAKGMETGEIRVLRKISKRITLRRYGTRAFITRPSALDRKLAARGLADAGKAISGGRFDVVILDEICGVCHSKIATPEQVVGIVRARPANVEIVLTGRNAPEEFIEASDLVTEMREVRHYFASGVKARKGIEF